MEGRWLQCNGVAVSRTTYALLFAYLNSLTPALPFGTGDSVTTFNLPDARGRIAVAEGENTSVDDMGDSDGVAIANRRPQHYHNAQVGGRLVGGTVPVAAAFDSTAMATQTPTRPRPGSTNNILNAPAHIVLGSYFVKYN